MSGRGADVMVYVAADPAQPGAAWAAFVDDPSHSKAVKDDMATEIASWVRKGANVMRVTTHQAREMMQKWERPKKPALHAQEQEDDLFAGDDMMGASG
mgnify:FL=1